MIRISVIDFSSFKGVFVNVGGDGYASISDGLF